ncbi:hypothetical protein KIPB_010312 [Kipferlia bialata]|uniref:Uncharacterized protein n=1 Tax=Kipferlia bialata TaxID=797122 RepID=A0A9K3D6C9_9EUKA|nr:hypothetical protein KIPB_010312 [Kipferlia bialata]|eukprot:g10312.t1
MDFSEWYTSAEVVLQELEDWWAVQLVALSSGGVMLAGMPRDRDSDLEYRVLSLNAQGTISQEVIPPPNMRHNPMGTQDMFTSRQDRSQTSVTADSGAVYVVHSTTWVARDSSGETTVPSLTHVYSLDMDTRQWREVEGGYQSLPQSEGTVYSARGITPLPRISPLSVCLDGSLLLLGGLENSYRAYGFGYGDGSGPSSHDTYTDTAEVLDRDAQMWGGVAGGGVLQGLKLHGERAAVVHDQVLYVCGSRGVWMRYTSQGR